ncbi:ZrgA family zinc uptake protein [Paraglaciecola chathamensis]|uniref:ZrgA family zinc uptake protein n=1 Tax=Paraglaciecola chathamensis TaxID=368405 RepID=UPI00270C0DF0|nr:DUF2796 domain-containing protein [Paraglaciecola chathamensis]MDO6559937.1 DUF2796 domain-containing protein [Paraglaciecola chathamensis]
MTKPITLLVIMMSCCFSAAAQVHQHGQGQLFASQEKQDWHVQFILPAADVIGFEHAPESAEQKKALQALAKRLTMNDSVVRLSGKCTLIEATHSLFAEHKDSQEHAAEHEHHEKDQHEEKHHATDDHENHEGHAKHTDVEVEYHFSCASSSEKLSVTLFEWLPTLNRIQAQWITDAGQGTATLTSTNPDVEW